MLRYVQGAALYIEFLSVHLAFPSPYFMFFSSPEKRAVAAISMRHLRASFLLVSLGGALMCGGMAQAQPQPIGTAMTKAQADQSAYASMLKQEAPLEKTDPAAALAMLQQFGQNHPTLDPDVRVSLLSKAAYLSNAGLKDGEGALKIANQSFKEAQTAVDAGASDFLLARVTLVKGHLLILNDKREEGEALLGQADNWNRFAQLLNAPTALERSYGEQAIGLLISSYEKTKRNAQAIAKMEELVKLNPSLLATNKSDIIDHMANNLMAADKNTEALSWGKLSFMLANFDNAAIARSTKLLARAWAGSGDLEALRDFTKAQNGDTSAKNPLDAIAMPAIVSDKTTSAALSELAGTWENNGRIHDAISAYVLAGQWLPAMQHAQEVWLKDPQSAAGAQEVGRVFKAADLAPTRGNAFVSYVTGGGETNPLKAFLQEHAADKKVAG